MDSGCPRWDGGWPPEYDSRSREYGIGALRIHSRTARMGFLVATGRPSRGDQAFTVAPRGPRPLALGLTLLDEMAYAVSEPLGTQSEQSVMDDGILYRNRGVGVFLFNQRLHFLVRKQSE